ncbi:hypothetical protein GO730_28260 [Spirosoma sp. HMF3257]|uniref:Uncharacterized protein n=1 Tax=Spirosoma telluris TaxID=2183553 RepID=A0A327NRN5_9BACT|nr:hypothetical protein [Spirosoma telluris]RAI77099.1 hypothetical protein HMF3257_28205 [Spirosoma telluris]
MAIDKGKPVVLKIDLLSGNINIRPDAKTFAINSVIPKGTTGVIKDIHPDEILIEFYVNPTNIPGHGSGNLIWVKRFIYGTLFD